MATNYIYPFAQPGGANVITDAAYAASTITTTTGYPADTIAQSSYMSKAQRQTSAIAAGIGQWLADNQATDVHDNLSPATIAAMINSALSGVAVTTQPQFDTSNSIATDAFVQRALGNLAGSVQYSINTALTGPDVGKIITPGAVSLAFQLPLISSGIPNGAQIIFDGNGYGCVIASQSPDVIIAGTSGSLSAVSLEPQDTAILTVVNGVWTVTGGELHDGVSSSFQGSLTTTGHKMLPGGFILNWINGISNGSGVLSAAWDLPFPNAVLIGWANESDAAGWNNTSCTVWGYDASGSSLSTGVAHTRNIAGTLGPVRAVASGTIFAIGY